MRLLTRLVVLVVLVVLFVIVTMFFKQVSFDHGPPSLPYRTFSITVGVLLFAALIALVFRRARSFWL